MPKRWRAGVAVVITIVALLPIIVVVLQRWGHPYLPMQDQAVLDLRVRDVWSFSANTPLTGPYSRFGWNHPGPLMYYLLAVFSRATGGAAWSSMVGNALLQAVAIIWIARLAFKELGLRWMTMWLAVVALSYLAMGPGVLQLVWNPNIAFPFFVLFLLQSWLVGLGRGRWLLGFAFVGTLLAQTHIGYVPLVLIIGAWALVRRLSSRRGDATSGWRGYAWLPPMALTALLWFPPLVLDPLRNSPSNVTRLVNYYSGSGSSHPGSTLDLSSGLGFLATEFRWIPPWLGGQDRADPLTGNTITSSLLWLVIPCVLVVVSWVLTWRRGKDDQRRLVEMLAILLVASGLTLSLVNGDLEPYLFYWRIIVGSATVLVFLYVLFDAVGGVQAEGTKVLSAIFAVTIIVSSATFATTVSAANGPVWFAQPVADTVLRQLDHEHQPNGRVIVRFSGLVFGGLQAALMDQLSRQGAPVFVDPGLGFEFGYGRTAKPADGDQVWYVTEDTEDFSLLASQPGARVLAQSHPLNPSEQNELVALQTKIIHTLDVEGRSADFAALGTSLVDFALAHTPGVSSVDLQRLAQLNGKANAGICLCAVIAFHPQDVPRFAYIPGSKPGN